MIKMQTFLSLQFLPKSSTPRVLRLPSELSAAMIWEETATIKKKLEKVRKKVEKN
jgi:hypothetical protein